LVVRKPAVAPRSLIAYSSIQRSEKEILLRATT
jgi:hypothetical protein